MTELKAIARSLEKYIKFVKSSNGFCVDSAFNTDLQFLTEDALADCEHLVEFSRRLSDQISIMAPAIIEIQSLMRD